MRLGGPFWGAVDVVNEHFEYVGYSIIGLFLLSTAVAVGVYRFRISPTLTAGGGADDGDGDAAWGDEPQMVTMSAQDEYLRARMLQLAAGGSVTAQSSTVTSSQPVASPRPDDSPDDSHDDSPAAELTAERATSRGGGAAAVPESQDDYLRRRMLQLAMASPTACYMDDCTDGPP